MQKVFAVVVSFAALLGIMAGCGTQEYQDGTYTASFAEFDARGYKDYVVVVVEGGEVTGIEYDAVNEEGGLKSEDEEYAANMEAVQNNYPEQVNNTLVNQYLAGQDLGKVDAVAGASYSTDCFTALFKALEENMYNGDTTPLVMENVPMR